MLAAEKLALEERLDLHGIQQCNATMCTSHIRESIKHARKCASTSVETDLGMGYVEQPHLWRVAPEEWMCCVPVHVQGCR